MSLTFGAPRFRRGRGRGPVLVLERDPVVRSTLARTVRRFGLLVAPAGGCADAVDRMIDARPSLVLIDTELPGWLDLLFTLREAFTPPVPVLLIGPHGRPGAQARTLPLCFHAPKPIDLGSVATVVAAVVARAGPRARPDRRPRRRASGRRPF